MRTVHTLRQLRLFDSLFKVGIFDFSQFEGEFLSTVKVGWSKMVLWLQF